MSFEDILKSPSPVLLNFTAEWCEPCKWAEPVFKEVIQNFNGKIILHKIDIDQHPELAREYHVLSVPTIILMKAGRETWRMRGFDTAPKLIRLLEDHL